VPEFSLHFIFEKGAHLTGTSRRHIFIFELTSPFAQPGAPAEVLDLQELPAQHLIGANGETPQFSPSALHFYKITPNQ